MKSCIEVNKVEKKEVTYPWLGSADDGTVVLFTSKGSGFVIYWGGGIVATIGEFCDNWVMSTFDEFKGKVILQN